MQTIGRPILAIVIILVVSNFQGCTPDIVEPQFTETILDRKIYIEPEIVLDVPFAQRWCERLDLKTHRINVRDGDCTLYVEEEGQGTPLVLINGGPGGTHHYFHPWFSRAAEWAKVIYYDQRGTGLSDFNPGEEGYSVEQAVRDLDSVREALNIDKWVVVGYSYGGFLAQFYSLNFPERTAGMVLLNGSPRVPVGPQDDRLDEFLSEQERARFKEIREEVRKIKEQESWNRNQEVAVLVYNLTLNGDWKRQNYHKPTPERMSEKALYEWVNDSEFNKTVNSTAKRYDLRGAFESCPIPTLICEGSWDMTWNTKKADIIHRNHPESKLVIFEHSGHHLFMDEPDRFFSELRSFTGSLAAVSEEELNTFRSSTEKWFSGLKALPAYALGAFGWGRSSSEALVKEYSRDWLDRMLPKMLLEHFAKVGFALYDMEQYGEALYVFENAEILGREQNQPAVIGVAKIWQGHMLDLLGERERARALYEEVAGMNLERELSYSQYGMKYKISSWAKERITSPFERVENRNPD